MRVHIIDHNTVHRPLIASMLTRFLPDLDCITIAKTNDNHEAFIKAADLIIISGGTRLVHLNPDTHTSIITTVLSAKKPLFGICLGAEAIASYFDADVVKMEKRVSGIVPVRLLDEKLVEMTGGQALHVYSHHIWTIPNLPHGFSVLADGPNGVEFFKHSSLPVWGTQFHPEVRRNKNRGYFAFIAVMQELGFATYTNKPVGGRKQ